jgi:hypothetical protein
MGSGSVSLWQGWTAGKWPIPGAYQGYEYPDRNNRWLFDTCRHRRRPFSLGIADSSQSSGIPAGSLDRTGSHLLLAALVTGFHQRTKDVMRPMNLKRTTEGESA